MFFSDFKNKILNSKYLNRIQLYLNRIDLKFNRKFEEHLPKNLTIRYVFSLCLIGLVAVVNQVWVQVNMNQQIETINKMRTVDHLVNTTDKINRSILSIQLSVTRSKKNAELNFIRSNLAALDQVPLLLEDFSDNTQLNRFKKIHGHFKSEINTLEHSLKSKQMTDSHFDSRITALKDITSIYESIFNQILDFYENESESLVKYMKQIEVILLLLFLLTLLFVGLYVFRPAVKGLYSALRVRSDFLSRISHEIRNPMNSVQGMSNLLMNSPLDKKDKYYVSLIQKSSDSLLELLDNLLYISASDSKKIKIEKSTFSVFELVNKATDIQVYKIQSQDIEFIIDYSMNLPTYIYSDMTKIQQIIFNLINNASKFTEEGKIVLRLELESKNDHQYLIISVKDTGIGISEEKQKVIFDSFVQEDNSIKRKYGGTGLGLSIVKEFTDLLKGEISLESTKGVGSHFKISIPVKVKDTESVKDVFDSNLLKDQNILLVEQSPDVEKKFRKYLKAMGASITTVSKVNELSKLIRKREFIQYSLILIDQDFSSSSIVDLLTSLKKEKVTLKNVLIFINSTTSSDTIDKYGTFGVESFLFKPIRPLEFIDALEVAIENKNRPLSKQKATVETVKPIEVNQSPMNILIVDDSNDNLFLMKAYLEDTKHRIVYESNPLLGLDAYKQGNFHLILLDIQMPEMDGHTLLKEIRNWEKEHQLEEVSVIAVTAHTAKEEIERINKSGFKEYLNKPVNPDELKHLLSKYNATKQTTDTHAARKSSNQPNKVDAIIKKLAPEYLRKRKEEISTIKTALDNQEFKTLQTIGHKLKGNAKNYGFEPLGKLGATLEEQACSEDINALKQTVLKIEQYISTL